MFQAIWRWLMSDSAVSSPVHYIPGFSGSLGCFVDGEYNHHDT